MRNQTFINAALALAATLLSFGAAPAFAGGWIKAESEHLIVYSHNDDKDTRRFISELETVYALSAGYYEPLSQTAIDEPEKPVYVYFSTLSEFLIYDPKSDNGFRNQKGCSDGRINFWTDVDDIGSSDYEVFRFASLLDGIAAKYDAASLPNWLSLGLSTFLMDAHIEGDTIRVGSATDFQFKVLAGGEKSPYSVFDKSDRIPFSDIVADEPAKDSPPGAFRAQSWVVVHYLLDHPEYTAKLKSFVALYRSGVPSADAWGQTLAIAPATFDQALDDYVKKGVDAYTYRVPALTDDQIALTRIADSGEAVPLLSAAAQTCPPAKDVNRILNKLSKAAQRAQQDAYTQREYLRAKALIGDPAEAVPALLAQTEARPDDFDAHMLLGRAYLRMAEARNPDSANHYTAARRELAKSYKLNGPSSALLYYYARAFADRPGYPDDNTLTAAETAVDLNPAAENLLYLAELYARRGQFDDMKLTVDRIISKTRKRPIDQVGAQIQEAADSGRTKEEILAVFATVGPSAFDDTDAK